MRRVSFAVALVAVAVACGTSETDGESSTSAVTPPAGQPGGPITVPVGKKCATDGECGGGRCEKGACIPGARCADDSQCNGTKCVGGGCVPASATDGIRNGDETDVDCGGNVAPRCATGKLCGTGTDCADGVCGGDKTCAAPTSSDGVKNGTETDIDCGGAGAPKCDKDKACVVDGDCFWGHCTNNLCEGHRAGTQDGDESDIDCGGTKSPGCDWWKNCAVDGDCASGACGLDNKCLPGASCKTVHGGSTCGIGEITDGFKQHESCCKSLPVPGYTDPRVPGKTVYVDKYEITAGRMRKFLETLGGGTDAKGNAKDPDVKAWIAAHPPARWNAGWSNVLPANNGASPASYTVKNPTLDLNYPGQDIYARTSRGRSSAGGRSAPARRTSTSASSTRSARSRSSRSTTRPTPRPTTSTARTRRTATGSAPTGSTTPRSTRSAPTGASASTSPRTSSTRRRSTARPSRCSLRSARGTVGSS